MTEARAKECLVIAVQALRDVVNPVGKLKREMAPVEALSGVVAQRWADMPETMRGIAREALREIGCLVEGISHEQLVDEVKTEAL